jgi:PAS domain S-box-containing protein
MSENPSTPVEDKDDEISALICRLIETEQRLLELTGGEVDAVLDPGGRSYLLRQAQEKLRHSEATQSSILNALPANIALVDAQGVILSVNEGWRKFAGENGLQDAASAVGQNYLEICERSQAPHTTEARKVAAGIRAVLEGRDKKFEMEYPCHLPTEQRWFRLLVSPTGKDRECGAVVMHIDVTERKRIEESLRESEERFSGAFAHAPIGMALVSPEGRWLKVNLAVCNLVGYSEAELFNRTFQDITHPDDLASDMENLRRMLAGEIPSYQMEKRYVHKQGHFVSVLLNVSLVRDRNGQPRYFISQIQDITERKRAEESLRESENKFSIIFQSSPVGIALSTINEGRYLDANHAFLKMLQLSRDEMIGHTSTQLGVWTGSEQRDAMIAKIKEHGAVHNLEMKVRGRAGKVTDILWSADIVVIGGEQCLLGLSRDITEWKRLENRFQRLVDSNAQGVIFWNTKGQITRANDFFLQLTGYTRADLEAGSINWTAMTPPECADLDAHALKQIAATGVCAPYEKEFIRKDGARVPILIGAAAFEDNPEEGVCFVLDLTDRKKIEHQFRQSQKMDSIGRLAGGVAHDFNNVLAIIQMQAGLLKSGGTLSEEQAAFTDEISATVERAANLTRQLLLFSRHEVMQLSDLDLNKSISNMAKMLARLLGENILMQFKPAAQPMYIRADAGMMDQVLMNLAVNARDAMSGDGQLVIETGAVEFDELAVSQSVKARVGPFVCLTVSDTGCGIPAEILPQIFEPFFTTKDVGKGTGLGLATVFGIVQQHQGWINIYSEVGHGTTFRIYLPRLAGMTDVMVAQKMLSPTLPGNETILLVEDDSSLRNSVCLALTRLGYRVLEAPNGVKALEVWKAHRAEISLLLTDLVMPEKMTGKDLAQRILQDNPKLKVIYMSGYSAVVASKDFPLQEGVNFLTKPFQTQKLAQAIRQNLDAPDPET